MGKTFIIAEAGSNHDGDFEQACLLIDAAAEAGADAIRRQAEDRLFQGTRCPGQSRRTGP